MRNDWLKNYKGFMKIRIKETTPEKFIRLSKEIGLEIWGIEYESEEIFTAHVNLEDLGAVKKVAKLLSCKVTFTRKKGAPFLWVSIWNRKGMVMGILSCFLCIIVLSNMVWKIEIDGATPELEHEVMTTIDELGVKKGSIALFLPPPEQIQTHIMNEREDITWVGVTRQGSSYHFQIVEKEIVEKTPATINGHLVATRKAMVHDFFVEKGKLVVRENELVEKGDILVSGNIGKEGEEKQVSATGTVLGEFWYKADIEVPLLSAVEELTGEVQKKHFIGNDRFQFPIWGIGKPNSEETVKEIFRENWEILGVTLPISYGYSYEYGIEDIEKELLKKEALEIAMEEGKKSLLDNFSNHAQIMDEKVLHQSIEGGKVKVSIHFKIIDDIAVRQPIIQGD
ncbi:sporulation protein YqfD [Salipaludibacillus sp. CF4.18]|uniref:sporulation protein YqfD n=1 Tax=Salipaludibacillus sp. CF4.18 TaxID=3373081 RepID=UPI003EE57999